MSQNVSRLKELLFDGEARALADLSRRIELVAASGEQQRRELAAALGRQIEQHARTLADEASQRGAEIQRLEALARSLQQTVEGGAAAQRDMTARLEAVVERAGSDSRLEIAVARVVDGALRRAEAEKHTATADAMAPLVTRTIKAEIRNSQDDLVEALYPMTGRMVKAYVASAMADLMAQIDRKLKSNPLMLRLKSLTTGRPLAELVLLESNRLAIEEVYLIRRGTGELLGRWPEARGQANRDQVMSGVLTAINDFSAEAFKEDGSALRHIDMESSQVYLRASPNTLLAVRCSGHTHAAIERIIDDEFLAALERHHSLVADDKADAPGHEADRAAELGELANRLGRRVVEMQEELSRPPLGLTPLRLAVLFIGLPLAAWLGWTMTEAYRTTRVRSVAQRVVETSSEVKGYPIAIDVAPWGRALTLSGLTPSETAREDVVKRLRELLPETILDNQLTVVPTGGFDTRPQIAMVQDELTRLQLDAERATLLRAVDRARLRLRQTLPDLVALRENSDDAARATVGRAIATVEHLSGTLATGKKLLAERNLKASDLSALKTTLEDTSRDLAAAQADVMGVLGAPPPSQAQTVHRATTIEAAEELATQAERLASTAIAAHQANVVGRRPAPERVVVAPPQPRDPTAIERLADLVRTNVVWFANQTEFRDDTQARALIGKAARLARESGVLLRVVGFTDDQGSAALNSQLSMARARRVADELVAQGFPRERLVTVGRPGFDISPTRGPRSANRRVELQIGFDGEEAE